MCLGTEQGVTRDVTDLYESLQLGLKNNANTIAANNHRREVL